MSPAREFAVRLLVTPPDRVERTFAGTVLFVGVIMSILFGGQVIAWALGYDQ